MRMVIQKGISRLIDTLALVTRHDKEQNIFSLGIAQVLFFVSASVFIYWTLAPEFRKAVLAVISVFVLVVLGAPAIFIVLVTLLTIMTHTAINPVPEEVEITQSVRVISWLSLVYVFTLSCGLIAASVGNNFALIFGNIGVLAVLLVLSLLLMWLIIQSRRIQLTGLTTLPSRLINRPKQRRFFPRFILIASADMIILIVLIAYPIYHSRSALGKLAASPRHELLFAAVTSLFVLFVFVCALSLTFANLERQRSR